jgi:Predicted membrane protein (DUF2127)
MPTGDNTVTKGPNPSRMAVRPHDDPTYDVDPGRGWVLFAGIMLAVVGALNVVYGIGAISDSTFYVRDVTFVVADLKTFGWALTVVGVVQLIVAVGIWRAAEWARWLGIIFASANIIIQFLAMQAHPGWAVLIFMVDVIIIFGLTTYGGRDRYNLAG